MSEYRFGTAGFYFGSPFNESEALSQSDMEVNSQYIYKWLSQVGGWSLNSIAGVLGNMQAESSINPGRWQREEIGNMSGGYGLVQWTPASSYIDWCYKEYGSDSDPSMMDLQLNRILDELNNNYQYYETDEYPLTFKEFTTSTLTPYYLARVFARNYERSYAILYGTEEEKEAALHKRGEYATAWYSYLSGSEPPGPVDPPTDPDVPPDPDEPTQLNKKRKYNFLLFTNARRRMQR